MRDVHERFWSKVDRSGECWNWRAGLNRGGYGAFRVGGKGSNTAAASRIAWELTNGAVPPGLFVLHRCDNRKCCNPAHLFLGTLGDNNRDCKAKGRNPKHDRHPQAKLTSAIVAEIRALLDAGARGIDVAVRFGVTNALVSQIRLNRIWR